MSAVEAVKAAIREIVDAEDRHKPLSDDALREALAAREMVMTTETVKLFRERMGIPIGSKRRIPGPR